MTRPWVGGALAVDTVLDALPFGVVLIDPNWRVVFSNAAAARLLSIGADGLRPGLNLIDVIVERQADGGLGLARDRLEQCLSHNDHETCTLEVDGTQGRRWLRMTVAPTVAGETVVALSDITEFRDRETWLTDRSDRLADEGEDLKELARRLSSARTDATTALRRAEQANEALSREISERRSLEHELRRIANTDELTGVLNRRRFVELLENEVERARRYQRPLALLMLDVDHFKRVNDRYGHGTGDAALRHFARVGSDSLRDADLFARLGGEEFAALLPETPLERALVVAQRLRRAVAAMPCASAGETIRLTVSIGVATLHAVDNPALGILGRADRALYAAKAAGRDCVAFVQARDEPIVAPADGWKPGATGSLVD